MLWARPAVHLILTFLLACLPWGVQACKTAFSRASSTESSVSTTLSADLAGVGDPYFPQAGNSGYDVLSYELALGVDPERGTVEGKGRVTARATAALDRLSLDLVGLKVKQVWLNGNLASFCCEGQELVVFSPVSLREGEEFVVEVSYEGTPRPLELVQAWGRLLMGWQHQEGFVYTMNEPVGAPTWYPVNDHPSDKAVYVFRVTVPAGYTAACGGTLVTVQRSKGRETFVWEVDAPLASYAAGLVVGKLVEDTGTAPSGVYLRNYFAPELADQAAAVFHRVGEILAFYSDLFGPYPFDVYGVAVVGTNTQGAMENQTLSLYGKNILQQQMTDPIRQAIYISHELAHQWFGNSVTPESWRDIWLNEGFATYASWMWLEKEQGRAMLEELVASSYEALSDQHLPPPADPGVENLFGPTVYERGALTLHALRQAIGEERFLAVLKEWASRYRYRNASTEDFIDLAVALTGQTGGQVSHLLESWLYQNKLPTMAGSLQN